MAEDLELLRCYTESGSEAAFAELVRRHVGLVYSAALRRVGNDAHLAQDVTQLVFTALARKAPTLLQHRALGGWLLRCTQFLAADAVRKQRRQARREQVPETMNPQLDSPDPAEIGWRAMGPVVDALLDQLNDTDRDAIILRFFEGRSYPEIGTTLRLTEDAARMRVNRAMERLRDLLARRGIASSLTAIGVALANHATASAPNGLATVVSATAMANAAALNGGVITAFFVMNKITIGISSALMLLGFFTGRLTRGDSSSDLAQPPSTAKSGSTPQLADSGTVPGSTQAPVQARPPVVTETPHEHPHLHEPAVKRPDLPSVLEPVEIGQMAWKTTPKEWQNVGRQSIGAAIQSQYWAISRGEIDYLKSSLVLEEDVRNAIEPLREDASPYLRELYSTPDSFAAFLLASCPALNGVAVGRILKDRSTNDHVTVTIGTLEPGADRFGGETLSFRRTDSGEWLRLIGRSEITRWRQMLKWDRELSKSRTWVVAR